MVDQGYQSFSVVLTSIVIALVILLLIIMFIDIIINKNGILSDSGFFKKLIYHLDIMGKIFKTRPRYNRQGIIELQSLSESSQESNSNDVKQKEQLGQSGGCGNCSNYKLSSSLTYDPQIFLKKRKY